MKVIPSNQTLILANERPPSGAKPSTTLGRALDSTSPNAQLRRVTIVAEQDDDSVVYVRADYHRPDPVTYSANPTRDGATPDADGTDMATDADFADSVPSHSDAARDTATVANSAAAQDSATSVGVALARSGAATSQDAWLPVATSSGALAVSSGLTLARDAYGNPQSAVSDARPFAHLRPAERYARTQRLSSNFTPVPRVDVRA